MDLKQIAYFVRVAELGSFTRASVALGIAQPALSRQVRLLEVELHQNLLERNGRGVKLTESGQLLLEHGRGILHQVEVAREALSASRSALSGQVSVALPPSLSRLIAVPLSQAFRRHLPQAHVTLTEGFSMTMFEGVRVGNVDMAVLYNPPHSPELELLPLHQEALVLISAQGAAVGDVPGLGLGALEMKDVAALPLILPSRPNVFRNLVDAEMMRQSLTPRIAMQVDGLNAILNLVRDGVGHAVLPGYTLRQLEGAQAFTARAIHSPRLLCDLSLAWSTRRPHTPTHQRALGLVQSVVQEILA
jgi:LysR family nitrogen assimilation transcriptional regulator